MTAVGTTAAIFGCKGPRLEPAEHAFFRDADPFGFIIFARNVETQDQLYRLTSDLRATVGRDAPVLVDQEGGRVQRLRGPQWREWAPPLDTINAAPNLAAACRSMALRASLIAAELRAVGIDANCAPVADIATDGTHPFLRNRCYGTDAAAVIAIARAVADAYLAGGVLPVVKHMPGHGRAVGDTHHDLPTVTADAATLMATDFAPFRALSDLPMAMTAHIVFAAYDGQNPTTQSPRMIEVIRNDIGFAGLLMTDDLNMQALSGSLADRTVRSLMAGCDLALHCSGEFAEMQSVADAAGPMRPETRVRAQAALAYRKAPTEIDIAAAEAALAQEPLHG
jgi:beta-N-acetylhexosaminidase